MSYADDYKRSLSDFEGFWRDQASSIEWFMPPDTIFRDGRWFVDGELNTSWLALDYHVQNGRADQDALIYDSPVTQTKQRYTYQELLDAVSQAAGAQASIAMTASGTIGI